MENSEKRMDKIVKSLTPRQAVVAWMAEAHQFNSLIEYALRAAEHPEDVKGFAMLIEEVELAVRERMQGKAESKVRNTVRDAVREAAFFYYLHLQVNQHFYSEARVLALMGLLLLERASAAERETMLNHSDVDQEDNWREDLRSHAIKVFSLKAATEQITKKYFDNNQVLWKSFAEQMELCIQVIHRTVGTREDALYFAHWQRQSGKRRQLGDHAKGQPHLNFDLKVLETSIDPSPIVKSLVDLAYAETLLLMGNRQAATKLVVSLFRPAA